MNVAFDVQFDAVVVFNFLQNNFRSSYENFLDICCLYSHTYNKQLIISLAQILLINLGRTLVGST